MDLVSEHDFRRIFERYYRPVCYFFVNRGIPIETSRDLTQETMLRAYKGMRSGGIDGHAVSFARWLFQIAANVWRNELRRVSAIKRDAEEVPLDKAVTTDPSVGPWPPTEKEYGDPLHAILDDERIQLLREALDELPRQMRRCVLLRIDQDLRYWEIAEVMKLSKATIKSQMHQARQRLKTRLQPYFASSPNRS